MWHTLALALGGRTVAEWQAVMTDREFRTWWEFYKLQPFDDRARYHRPAALVAHSMGGADLGELIGFLANDAPKVEPGRSAVDLSLMKAFGVKPPEKE